MQSKIRVMISAGVCIAALATPALAGAQTTGGDSSGVSGAVPGQEAQATSDAAAVPAAQSGGDGLGDIIVTAQRREESAQRVSISMSVVGSDELSTLKSSNEIGKVVPNVQIEETYGMGIPRVSIRGIAQGDYNPNTVTSNMIYLDDVPLNAAIAQGVPIWDLGRAEVLRGPQGTLFGRNATGGAIRYIAAMPTRDWEGHADVTLGRFSQNAANFVISGPVSDTLGIRLSYTGNRSSGDVYNVVMNERQGRYSYHGVRGVVEWKPADALTAVLRAQYFKSDAQPLSWKTTPGIATRRGFGPLPDGRSVADIQQSYGFQNLGYSSNYTIAENGLRPLERLKHLPVSLNLDLDLGGVTLTSVTGYLKVDQDFAVDLDASPAPMLDAYYKNHSKQYSQELRLASDGSGPFTWILGAFYMHERVRSTISYDATEYLGALLFPNAGAVFYSRGSDQETESYAGFVHTTYEVAPRLKVTAAARYTWEGKDIDYRFRSLWAFPTTVPHTPFETIDFARAMETGNWGTQLAAPAAPLSGSKSWKNLSWKVALDYQASDDTLLYALVSRGFKGGAFKPSANVRSEVLNPDGSVLSVHPEVVTDYEVGVKSDIIPRQLRVNASIYYYDFKDYQTNQLLPSTATQVLSNLPKSRLFGAEIEMTAMPVDGLKINAALGVIDSKITDSLDPALIGNRLPFAENFNANAGISYDIDVGFGRITPEISGKYRGRYFVNKDNDVKLGGYLMLNGQISFESDDAPFYGSLWAKNLTNKRKTTAVDVPTEFWGSNNAFVTPRRTYGVTVGARF